MAGRIRSGGAGPSRIRKGPHGGDRPAYSGRAGGEPEILLGHSTQDLSQRFGLSPGQSGQLRRQFERGWRPFCDGQPVEERRRVRVA
jgi:hypothetical protein